ncbi:MAG: metallophosphoesterase family protein [Proteobacteria bacterium]|nr:metallophosphoesterase family protein [Pseudomonadota bacterium]
MPTTRIGLIADTHNLLRPEAAAWLAGCAHILHAGDICGPEVLEALGRIAPVTAVRGNNDHGPWAEALPEQHTLDIAGVRIHLLHDLGQLAIDPAAEGVQVVLSGHSHKPLVQSRGGVLFVNPGSAGPRRFTLPISAGALWVDGTQPRASLHTLVS